MEVELPTFAGLLADQKELAFRKGGIMAVDIVVIGRLVKNDAGGASYASLYYQGSSTGGNQVVGDYVMPGAGGTDTVTIAVNVEVDSDSNLEGGKKAAANIARALAKLKDELEGIDPNANVTWNGESMKSSDLLEILNTTKWVVSDNPAYNNGGVGSADAINNRATVDFRLFDGDLTNGVNDFAHPNYVDDGGLKAILLHEAAHLSDSGYGRWSDSMAYHQLDGGNSLSFYADSGRFAYRIHLEKWANEFAYAAADIFLDEDLTIVGLTHGIGSLDPIEIHAINNQWSPMRDDLNIEPPIA